MNPAPPAAVGGHASGILWVLHGMKRSGNHAITNWLLPKTGCAWVNNAVPLGGVLRGRPRPVAADFAVWRRERGLPPGGDLLVTLEDHPLDTLPFPAPQLPTRRLLVVRHADQMFSSRIRKAMRVDMPAYPRRNDTVMQRAVAIWKEHARCYLDGDPAYPGRVAILFDAWFADPHYRAAACTALGLPFDDRGFDVVSGEGGGSSFDGTAFDGRAHLMGVTDRVAALDADERALLDEVLGDPELQALHRAVREADPYRCLAGG